MGAIQMGSSHYVVGGVEMCFGGPVIGLSSCKRFDLDKYRWLPVQHFLPYSLHSAMTSTSADESIALITGGMSRNWEFLRSIIIFTEKEGFLVLQNLNIQEL